MKKCVSVVSGGGDSVTNALMMLEQKYEVIFLYVDHGQKCNMGEQLACSAIVSELQSLGFPCSLQIVESKWLGKLGGSGLTDASVQVPDGLEGIYGSTIEKIFTPNRNAFFLGIAGALAERYRAEFITLGCNQSEVLYLDNTKDFLDAYTKVLKYSCYHIHPKVISPEWEMDKPGIYKWGIDNGFDWVYNLTWSCDDYPYIVRMNTTKREDVSMCGHCGCDRNKQLVHFILTKLYGDKYKDTAIYADSNWFVEAFLPTIEKKGIPKNKWFSKYAEVLECNILE